MEVKNNFKLPQKNVSKLCLALFEINSSKAQKHSVFFGFWWLCSSYYLLNLDTSFFAQVAITSNMLNIQSPFFVPSCLSKSMMP